MLYEKGDKGKVPPGPGHAGKIARILGRLDAVDTPQEMALPGYRLHCLKGDKQGLWAVAVSGNLRVIFRFSDGCISDVDRVDYHQGRNAATRIIQTVKNKG